MRKDDDLGLSTHSLRTVVYIRKGVLYGIVKKSVKIRKLFLYAFFTGSLGIRKIEISCCDSDRRQLGTRLEVHSIREAPTVKKEVFCSLVL